MFKYVAAIGLACLAVPAVSHAAFILTLTDGVNPAMVIPDNGPGDINPAVGAIVFNGPIGNFTTNITTGLSNSPSATPATLSLLQVQSIDVHNAGPAGVLTVTLGDTGYTFP